jgi:hypothetical protein
VLAREWLAVRKPGWTDKNFEKEQGRLENHAFPFIGGRPVASLGVADIRPSSNACPRPVIWSRRIDSGFN